MISINMHNVTSIERHHFEGAVTGSPFSVVRISDASGNEVTIYSATVAQAEAIARALSAPPEEAANADA